MLPALALPSNLVTAASPVSTWCFLTSARSLFPLSFFRCAARRGALGHVAAGVRDLVVPSPSGIVAICRHRQVPSSASQSTSAAAKRISSDAVASSSSLLRALAVNHRHRYELPAFLTDLQRGVQGRSLLLSGLRPVDLCAPCDQLSEDRHVTLGTASQSLIRKRSGIRGRPNKAARSYLLERLGRPQQQQIPECVRACHRAP